MTLVLWYVSTHRGTYIDTNVKKYILNLFYLPGEKKSVRKKILKFINIMTLVLWYDYTHRGTYIDTNVKKIYTVKPAYVVTSIKQSPVLKGHIFLVLS